MPSTADANQVVRKIRGAESDPPTVDVSASLIAAALQLRRAVSTLSFAPPVTHVYSPLQYAWEGHRAYLRRYGNGCKQVLFLGMNPGPFGMVQTGIPFGQVAAVRDWLGIHARVVRPAGEHPKRPVLGWRCNRSEISGERLWGLFAKRFGSPQIFFRDHFVANYCPLAFLEITGRNRTPDKLPPSERIRLFSACDQHLRALVQILRPKWLVAIGDFAAKRGGDVLNGGSVKIARILHPSPACPASNRDWAVTATAQLRELGIWR